MKTLLTSLFGLLWDLLIIAFDYIKPVLKWILTALGVICCLLLFWGFICLVIAFPLPVIAFAVLGMLFSR